MKRSLLFLLTLFLTACGTRELTREEATRLIVEHGQFPRLIQWPVYTGDFQTALRFKGTRLVREGFVKLQNGKRFIVFQKSAEPYLLPVTEEDAKHAVQPVKLADKEFVAITGIQMSDDGMHARVRYTTHLANLSPFVEMAPKMQVDDEYTLNFEWYDTGWVIERSGMELR